VSTEVLPEVIPALTIGGFEATMLGLTITGQPGYEVWEAYGRGLQGVQSAIHWVIGDWLNYGEARYGDTYTQALELTPYSLSTLQSDKWVANAIPSCNRLVGLAWKVHREVGGLPVEEQMGWLVQARDNEWSAPELREAIHGTPTEEERLVRGMKNIMRQISELLFIASMEDMDALLLAMDTIGDRIDARKEE